jgi:TolB-like protein/DNA-binding winged helix-turn-helix (wHTH) protein
MLILQYLALHPGQLVTRESLRGELWAAGTHVDFEHGLNLCIHEIRAALQDDASSPKYIETFPRRGYRFIGKIDAARTAVVVRAETGDTTEQPVAVVIDAAAPPSRLLHTLAITAYCIAAAIVIVSSRPGVRDALASLVPAQRVLTTVALLPLTNTGDQTDGDTLAAFVNGELQRQLEAVDSLRVISSGSMAPYRESKKSPIEIGRELQVSILVSGTMLRNCDRTILDIQVVDARSGESLWAHRYDTTFARLSQTATDAAKDITHALAASQ